MEFTNIKGSTWLIAGPVNIGAYVENGEVTLIDSGNDESAGRKILRLIEAKGWTLRWIVNTHSHADHIGGNALLQKRTGCKIAAPALERPFIEHPLLEPQLLWSGNAPKGLRNKFLQAEPSCVARTFDDGETLEEFGLEAVGLPGHMPGQIGVRTPDNVFFVADTILPERVLIKYGIPFVADYDAAQETLGRMTGMTADLFIPSHGEPAASIDDLLWLNCHTLIGLRGDVMERCDPPITRDMLLAAMAYRHGIEMNLGQYGLLFSTIATVLTSLIDAGEVVCDFSTGTLLLSAPERTTTE